MTDFVNHSFRTGTATTAATAELDDSTRQMLGRWKKLVFTLRKTGSSPFGISGYKISKVLNLIYIGCLTPHVNQQTFCLIMSHLCTCIRNVYGCNSIDSISQCKLLSKTIICLYGCVGK